MTQKKQKGISALRVIYSRSILSICFVMLFLSCSHNFYVFLAQPRSYVWYLIFLIFAKMKPCLVVSARDLYLPNHSNNWIWPGMFNFPWNKLTVWYTKKNRSPYFPWKKNKKWRPLVNLFCIILDARGSKNFRPRPSLVLPYQCSYKYFINLFFNFYFGPAWLDKSFFFPCLFNFFKKVF